MNLSKKLVCYFASLVLYIFLKQPCMNVRYFVVNCALFWFWGYARETSLDRSKTWVDNNIRFSASILCTKKWLRINNYRTARWHIRPQSDDEQGINKLQPNSYYLFPVLGQLPPKKIAPNPKTNPNPNLNPNQCSIFLRGNCLVTPQP